MSGRAATRVAKTAVTDAANFVKFVDASPSPYHATATAVARFEAAGFTRLSEKDTWSIEAGGKYYVTRNQSTVVRCRARGRAWSDTCGGAHVVPAHACMRCPHVGGRGVPVRHGHARYASRCRLVRWHGCRGGRRARAPRVLRRVTWVTQVTRGA